MEKSIQHLESIESKNTTVESLTLNAQKRITIPVGLNLNDIKPPYNLSNNNYITTSDETLKNIAPLATYFENDLEREIKRTEKFIKILDKITPVIGNHIALREQEHQDKNKRFKLKLTGNEIEFVGSLIVIEVLKQAQLLDLDIIHLDFEFRIYNGTFFECIDIEILTTFIVIAARKSGLEVTDSRSERFYTLLKKQLGVSAKSNKRRSKIESKLNLGNGVICITKDGFRFREHSKDDLFTYVLPFDYEESATCPKYDKYLQEVLPDPEARVLIRQFSGYIIADNLNLAKVLICLGDGRNGKSVYFKILTSLLGQSNVSNFTLKELCDNPNARIQIENKLLNYSDEMSRNFDSTIFKMLAAGDPVSGKLLYQDIRRIESYAKLAFSTNDFPYNKDRGFAYYQRFLLIDFNQTIPKERRNPYLHEEIVADELPGILNHVLDGLVDILKNKRFSDCASSDAVLDTFKLQNDNVLQFLDEYDYVQTTYYKCKLADLYQDYSSFCEKNGFKSGSSKTLSKSLKDKGFTIGRAGSGGRTHVWIIERSRLAFDTAPIESYITKNKFKNEKK